MSGPTSDAPEHAWSGTVDGASVAVRFLRDGHGSVTLEWTEIEVPYTPGTPYVMFAIRWGQSFSEGLIREGLVRDLELGDPAFDREFIVDAAPADIARALLDAPTRAQMLRTPVAIRTRPSGLVVHRDGWVADLAALDELVRFTLAFARRIEPVAEASVKEQLGEAHGTYRTQKTADDIARERAADVALLKDQAVRRAATLKVRARRWQWFFWSLVLGILAAVLGLVAWGNR